jgi:hypothetical protein
VFIFISHNVSNGMVKKYSAPWVEVIVLQLIL